MQSPRREKRQSAATEVDAPDCPQRIEFHAERGQDEHHARAAQNQGAKGPGLAGTSGEPCIERREAAEEQDEANQAAEVMADAAPASVAAGCVGSIRKYGRTKERSPGRQ